MAVKPTNPIVKWATDAKAEKIAVSDAKRARGWQASSLGGTYGETPPYQWFNYMMNSYGEWIDYLSTSMQNIAAAKAGLTIMDLTCTAFNEVNTIQYVKAKSDKGYLDQTTTTMLTGTYIGTNQLGFELLRASPASPASYIKINQDGLLKIQMFKKANSLLNAQTFTKFSLMPRNPRFIGSTNIAFGSHVSLFYGMVANIVTPQQNSEAARIYNSFSLVHSQLFYFYVPPETAFNRDYTAPVKLDVTGGSMAIPVKAGDKISFDLVIRIVFASDDLGSNVGTLVGQPPSPNDTLGYLSKNFFVSLTY